MIRTQVYLREQQYHLAKLYAEQDGEPFAEALREALDLWIAQRQNKRGGKKDIMAWAGSIKAKPSRPDMEFNEIYDGKLSQELEE